MTYLMQAQHGVPARLRVAHELVIKLRKTGEETQPQWPAQWLARLMKAKYKYDFQHRP